MRAVKVLAMFTALLLWYSSAQGAFVSFFLNQTNLNPTLPDGANYARVTIDDNTANTITFTVSLLGPLTSLASQNLGIQNFGFNVIGADPLADASGSNSQWTLPAGWIASVAPPPNQLNGFGSFDVAVSATGTARMAPLVFQVSNTGLALSSFERQSTGGAIEGNVLFAAHIAGFTTNAGDTSGFFGGSALAPVPVPESGLLFPAGLAAILALLRKRAARMPDGSPLVSVLLRNYLGTRTRSMISG